MSLRPKRYDPESITKSYVILYYGKTAIRAWLGPDLPLKGTRRLHGKVVVYPTSAQAVDTLVKYGKYNDKRYRVVSLVRARKILAAQPRPDKEVSKP